MALPKFLQPYLASYDLKRLERGKDKKLIITEILNKGDGQAVRWLGKNYSLKEIKKAVFFPLRGMWMESILDYWQKILDINLDKKTFNQAIINLNQF